MPSVLSSRLHEISRGVRGQIRVRRLLGRYAEFLIAGVVLMVGAYSVLTYEPGYVSSATVVFVDTPTVEQYAIATQELIDPLSQSPLARFQDATIVGDVFARLYRSAGKMQQLRGEGFAGQLVITTKSSVLSATPEHGPVFVMTVVAPTPAAAEAGAALVLADVVAELGAQQAGYDPALSVGAAVLATPTIGAPVVGSRMRATFGFSMLALLILLAVRHVRLKILGRRRTV